MLTRNISALGVSKKIMNQIITYGNLVKQRITIHISIELIAYLSFNTSLDYQVENIVHMINIA